MLKEDDRNEQAAGVADCGCVDLAWLVARITAHISTRVARVANPGHIYIYMYMLAV